MSSTDAQAVVLQQTYNPCVQHLTSYGIIWLSFCIIKYDSDEIYYTKIYYFFYNCKTLKVKGEFQAEK